MTAEQNITITPDGPYIVQGGIPLDEQVMVSEGHHRAYQQGQIFEMAQETYALCRCGHSSTPPFCDGSHAECGFDGSELANTIAFDERVELFEGPTLDLYDDNRCAFARFCHQDDGEVWTLTAHSDDPTMHDEAIKAATDCPAGRLVLHDRQNGYAEIEPDFDPSISILQDPERGVSAPLYIKGKIPLISAEDKTYETRNRYTLCRCGESQNKPFCDASHVTCGYIDGLES